MTKRYMLTEPGFHGGALLAAGSIITEDDLPVGGVLDTATGKYGKPVRSAPPESAVQIDAKGNPVDDDDAELAAALGLGAAPLVVAPVAPHAPYPEHPQALPPGGPGEQGAAEAAGLIVPAAGVGGEAGTVASEGAASAATVATPKRRGQSAA